MKIRIGIVLAVTGLLVVLGLEGRESLSAQVTGNDNNMIMVDDCLPGDTRYPSGCPLKAHEGDVSAPEFDDLLTSPLISSFVGHPSWRNEPGHLTTRAGRTVRLTNRGGTPHTLTRVEEFGGGSVGLFNTGSTRAPECPSTPAGITDAIPPGGEGTVAGLQPGLNKYQCCLHPWMRATIRVE